MTKKPIDPLASFRRERVARDAKRENRALLARLHEAEARVGVVDAMREGARKPRPVRAPRTAAGKRVATPVFLCSDWHVEEVVRPEKVLGSNAYNPTVATERAERLTQAMEWMVSHHRKSFEIRELVVWLGGDLITGYIHEELRESNALSPTRAVLLVQELVTRLLERLLAIPGIERVIVPCSYGNHGRTTAKSQISTGADNSFEWLLYQQLARVFARQPRVEWHISNGEFLHLDVHGFDLGFTHGDAATYHGGVGGITIPINKAIAKWDTHQRADVWNMGHFHQLHDMPRFVVNGSLIGTSPYGLRVGGYEAPAQASYLIDSKRGKCMSTTLWVAPSRRRP